jgi:long-chain acyl-CoA synthetase
MNAPRARSNLPSTALWPEAYASLGDLLADAFVQFKSEVALIEASRQRETARYTYLDVWRAGKPLGRWLETHSLGEGDRLAILMTNQPSWLIAASAALIRGLTLVPIDYKLTGEEQAALLLHARPGVLIVEYGLWRRLPAHGVPRVVVTEAPAGADLQGAVRWEDLPPAEGYTSVPRHRPDIACIVYSSGTGGAPKGCMLTHGNYLAQWSALASLYPMKPGDRFFSILPTNHAIDFMTGFLGPFACGGTVVHQRTLRPEYLRWTLQTYQITHMALVPRLLQALREGMESKLDEAPAWQRALLDGLQQVNRRWTRDRPDHAVSSRLLAPVHAGFGGSLRLMFAGGAFVPPDLVQYFYNLGFPVVIGYGLTEACTVVTVQDLRPFRPDGVGPPVPGTRIRIAQPGPDGVGEVQVLGPTVFVGYLDAPDATAEAFTADGWLRTGDLGRVDGAGHLHLVGRAKNMIVTDGGKNVYAEDVEVGFRGVAGATELAVMARNYIWPKRTLVAEQLLLVVRSDGPLSPDTLAGLRRKNLGLAEHKRVHGVLAWPKDFPLTASLKLKRAELAATLREQASEADIMSLEGP